VQAEDPGQPILLADAPHQFHDRFRRRRIQTGDRLIGQQELRTLHQGACDPHSLATLAAKRTVLLLEDDTDINEMLALWMRSLGIHAVRTSTVAEATQLISDLLLVGSHCHALLADYRLPDATGVRAIEEFMAAFPKRPVALMTAYHDLPVAVGAKTRRIPIFLKPLDRPAVLDWLHRVTHAWDSLTNNLRGNYGGRGANEERIRRHSPMSG